MNRLKFMNSIYSYDGSLENKINFMFDYYRVTAGEKNVTTFRSFIKHQIYRTDRRIKYFRFISHFGYRRVLMFMLMFILFLVLRIIFYHIKANVYDSFLICFLQLMYMITLVMCPTDRMNYTMIAYKDYLEELLKEEKKLNRTLDLICNNLEVTSIIKINLTRNELAAGLALHLKSNIIELRGISRKSFCEIIEKHCCNKDENRYIKLETILSDFVSDDLRNTEVSSNSYLGLINQNQLK